MSNLLMTVNGIASKGLFQLKKHSPTILVVSGIAGLVGAGVLACKETLSPVRTDILEEADACREKIREFEAEGNEAYVRKATTTLYIRTAGKFIKLYAPSAILASLSIVSILSGHGILNKRHTGLAAAYATLNTAFKDYRGNVVERFGEEIDRQLKHNVEVVEIEETVVDGKGREKVVKKKGEVVKFDPNDPNTYSVYAKFFDVGNPYWEKDPEYNLMFLRQKQSYLNDKLKSFVGNRIFLNEVYQELGLPKTKAGQIVGWKYDPDNPNIDNYIDFGIYDIRRPANRDFVNGYERTILLDFNVDGNILDDWKGLEV